MDVREALRSANERVDELTRSFGGIDLYGTPDRPSEYVCECADLACVQSVELTRAEYRAIRAQPLRFLVAHGHVAAADRVVEQHGWFAVIERAGPASSRQPALEQSR